MDRHYSASELALFSDEEPEPVMNVDARCSILEQRCKRAAREAEHVHGNAGLSLRNQIHALLGFFDDRQGHAPVSYLEEHIQREINEIELMLKELSENPPRPKQQVQVVFMGNAPRRTFKPDDPEFTGDRSRKRTNWGSSRDWVLAPYNYG